jgi:hypothetical protein
MTNLGFQGGPLYKELHVTLSKESYKLELTLFATL